MKGYRCGINHESCIKEFYGRNTHEGSCWALFLELSLVHISNNTSKKWSFEWSIDLGQLIIGDMELECQIENQRRLAMFVGKSRLFQVLFVQSKNCVCDISFL